MADTRRFIEVVASARVSRIVESYRAKIKITVTTRRHESSLAESLALRDRVINALKEAGIDAGNIEEGGGQVTQSSWSSTKTVIHELCVTHPEMPSLIDGMGKVENVFAGIKQKWFSGIKRDFSFTVPTAEFSEDADAIDEALKKAVQHARSKANSLAQEAALQLGEVVSIVEESPRQREAKSGLTADDPDYDSIFAFSAADTEGFYTPTSPTQSINRTRFRICFEVQESA